MLTDKRLKRKFNINGNLLGIGLNAFTTIAMLYLLAGVKLGFIVTLKTPLENDILTHLCAFMAGYGLIAMLWCLRDYRKEQKEAASHVY